MTLLSFVEELPERDRSLAMLTRTEPEQLTPLLGVEPRTWRGFWTYDSDRVQRITRYVERSF